MIEELTELQKGKAISIKNKTYFDTNSYIQPFIDRLTPFNVEFRCQVKVPEQLSITNYSQDLIYPRVNILAIFSQEPNKLIRKAIGMTYGLDLKTPLAKFFAGGVDQDYNFITFDKDALCIQEIEEGIPLNYSCIHSLIERIDVIPTMIESISSVYVERDNLHKLLGEWVDFTIENGFINESGRIKLSSSLPIDVYKSIVKDKDSDFYIEQSNPITLLDVYSTFLSFIKEDKDIINKFEKTILVNRLLRL